jgi:hypothetical protein
MDWAAAFSTVTSVPGPSALAVAAVVFWLRQDIKAYVGEVVAQKRLQTQLMRSQLRQPALSVGPGRRRALPPKKHDGDD